MIRIDVDCQIVAVLDHVNVSVFRRDFNGEVGILHREFQTLAGLATRAGVENGRSVTIRAPLLHKSKADIVRIGTQMGVDYSATVSCYQADGRGRACGCCDACRLRCHGFEQAGVTDPTIYSRGLDV